MKMLRALRSLIGLAYHVVVIDPTRETEVGLQVFLVEVHAANVWWAARAMFGKNTLTRLHFFNLVISSLAIAHHGGRFWLAVRGRPLPPGA